MPVKMQYPIKLHKDTKCPQCGTGINDMGGSVYVCQTGHMIEGVVLVTLRPKQKAEDKAEPLTPSYDKVEVKQ